MNNKTIRDRLTEEAYWDNFWSKIQLPLEMKKTKDGHYINELLTIFDTYLTKDSCLSIAEIGGAPGQFLAYMHNNFGYDVNCIDYSEIGCIKTKENFDMLNICGHIYQKDIFSERSGLPLFDIVYSMGVVEHFLDVDMVIQKHLELLKPGGILIIGLPNFLGIYKLFLKRLAPNLLSQHNLSVMDLSKWKKFREKYRLIPLFEGYVGGFEPKKLLELECRNIFNYMLFKTAVALYLILHSHFRILRKFNSKYTSGYLMLVYKKNHT